MHALDERNTQNHKDIHDIAYHSDKKRHNWKSYVLSHKKCHDVQTALVEQEFISFTDREKVNFLPDGIKCNMIDSVISVVSGGTARADFESAQLMLDEHIGMLTERSKFSNRNILETYVARGNRPGRGDCGRGGCNGGGGRGSGARIMNV